MKPKLTILLSGAALVVSFAAFAEPSWPADFAAQEAARRAEAALADASSVGEAVTFYDTLTWTADSLAGLGTAAAPFETRTFTQESAVCEWLKTMPVTGLLLFLR